MAMVNPFDILGLVPSLNCTLKDINHAKRKVNLLLKHQGGMVNLIIHNTNFEITSALVNDAVDKIIPLVEDGLEFHILSLEPFESHWNPLGENWRNPIPGWYREHDLFTETVSARETVKSYTMRDYGILKEKILRLKEQAKEDAEEKKECHEEQDSLRAEAASSNSRAQAAETKLRDAHQMIKELEKQIHQSESELQHAKAQSRDLEKLLKVSSQEVLQAKETAKEWMERYTHLEQLNDTKCITLDQWNPSDDDKLEKEIARQMVWQKTLRSASGQQKRRKQKLHKRLESNTIDLQEAQKKQDQRDAFLDRMEANEQQCRLRTRVDHQNLDLDSDTIVVNR